MKDEDFTRLVTGKPHQLRDPAGVDTAARPGPRLLCDAVELTRRDLIDHRVHKDGWGLIAPAVFFGDLGFWVA
jgi:hypothetical protein